MVGFGGGEDKGVNGGKRVRRHDVNRLDRGGEMWMGGKGGEIKD